VLEIKDGNFSGEAPVGKNKVGVYIYSEVARPEKEKEKYGGEKSKKNTLPAKYWGADTTLSADVTASGPNEFKFAVTSTAPAAAQDSHHR